MLQRPLEPDTYTSREFNEYCRRNKIRRSLGRTGICYDNAVSESTFATYKKELIHTRPWPDLRTLQTATADWIENYFNSIRRHSTLSPDPQTGFEPGSTDWLLTRRRGNGRGCSLTWDDVLVEGT